MVDEGIKPKPEKLILMIESEPPPQVQKNEPPYKRKKRKGEGYEKWLDKWPWKTKIIKSLTYESFTKGPSWVLAPLSHQANDIKQSVVWEATRQILFFMLFESYLFIFNFDSI